MAEEIRDFEEIDVEVGKKESFWDKTKSTASKAWNSKPAKVVKGIALVAVGAVGALALSHKSTDTDVIDPECLDDILANVDVTEI